MPEQTGRGEAGAIARAEHALAAWARGEDQPADELARVARTAEAQPGVLDGSFEELSGVRRRALTVRLRELAAEGHQEHEALAALADRIEELPDTLVVRPEQELLLLRRLAAEQPQPESELVLALADAEEIDERAVTEWTTDAQDRGLIELAEPGSTMRRWVITDAGLRAIGLPPAR